MAKKTKITDLTFDDKNFNRGTAYGKTLMEKSLSKFGAGRSVLIDKNNRIIAGNKTAETFGEIGLENVQIVETDGTTLIAVKRTDIDLDTPQGRELALADNQTAKVNIDFDFEVLEGELEADTIAEWGLERKETDKLSTLEYEDIYYTPKEIPNIKLGECIDTRIFQAKVDFIETLNLGKAQKELLKKFAYRFIKIDFESVANYYFFNASEEEKKAMERLRLVLCDGGINGFIDDGLLKVREVLNTMGDD